MNTQNTMKTFRVSVWASIDIEAKDIEDAYFQAQDAVIGCNIKARDFEFEAEEIEG